MDESMRLNWSMLNNGFTEGIQAVIMLRFIETLHSDQFEHVMCLKKTLLAPNNRIDDEP